MKPHRGTLILIFGILSIVVCSFLGIPAWIMGNNDLKEMDSGLMDPAGRDNTNAGRICGMIGTILMVVGCFGGAIAMLFYLGTARTMIAPR